MPFEKGMPTVFISRIVVAVCAQILRGEGLQPRLTTVPGGRRRCKAEGCAWGNGSPVLPSVWRGSDGGKCTSVQISRLAKVCAGTLSRHNHECIIGEFACQGHRLLKLPLPFTAGDNSGPFVPQTLLHVTTSKTSAGVPRQDLPAICWWS